MIIKHKKFIFFDTILFIGFIASLISCIALFIPSFNAYLRDWQLEITGGESENQMAFRFFGFASNLSSAYGYMQGLLASLCLLMLDKNHIRYAFYFIVFVISVLINARTGIFPIAITIVYLSLHSIFKFQVGQLAKLVIGGLIAIISVLFIINTLSEVRDFVDNFFDQLYMMFLAEDSNLESSAYITMIKFPETIGGIIFGEGYSLFNMDAGMSSDIGYINQIFIGGIIFVGSLLLYEIIVFVKILRWSKEYVFSTIFFLSILIFNYKGFNFYSGGAYIKFYMIYYFILVHNQLYPQCKITLR